jgi:hypothetical protein
MQLTTICDLYARNDNLAPAMTLSDCGACSDQSEGISLLAMTFLA